MCYYPKLRITLDHADYRFNGDYENFIPVTKKGWNKTNKAYIIDKRDKLYLKDLLFHYGRSIAQDIEEIPCGQCLECRIKWSKELAQRALAESTLHDENYFITLTYDDVYLPKAFCLPPGSDEPGLYGVINKPDFELFAKRLREHVRYHYDKEIRIFYCGEYGEIGGRPHFHAIIYGLPLKDSLKTFKYFSTKNKKWMSYEVSPVLDKLWNKGLVVVAPVTWETCAYVARYVTKKLIGVNKKDHLAKCKELCCDSLPFEFHQTPKRPGLGLEYFQDNLDAIYKLDKVVLPNGFVAKPCKYYDDKYDVLHPEDMSSIKEARKQVMNLRSINETYEYARRFGLDPSSDDFYDRACELQLDQKIEGFKQLSSQAKERQFKKRTRGTL